MRLTGWVLTSVILLGAGASTEAQSTTIIHAGQLLAVPGEPTLSSQTVVVRNGLIESVRSGYLDADQLGIEDADVVDLKSSFVLPGLIDMHTHVTGERDPESNPHEWVTRYEASVALEATQYLERILDAGFTTVRNVGADHKVILPLKEAVEKEWIAGPRIIAAAGGVSATGGHGDMHGYRDDITALYPRVGICDGADDCRRAVRALVKQGAELIKITATGGVLSNTAAGVGQQLTDDELKAIVETAHSLGRKVAAHAHAAGGINAALRAGVDSIEHGSFLDDESVRLFRKTGAYLVPTLLAGASIAEELEVNDDSPPAIKAKIAEVSPAMRAANPTVILIPGVGMIAWGKDKSESRVTAEFYNCAIEVMRGAEAIDEYIALPEQEAFDIEYWLL
ncbi:MAG: amidohydrolase family protein, partial [Acidobacteria bacterium]|nr:amidohydrolase family protein [Acidobacteriota bacterium]